MRSRDWRYIRYNNGKEELYNHQNDSLEHANLAANPEFASVKAELKSELISMANLDLSKPVPSSNLNQKAAAEKDKKSAEEWKASYFKKNPAADVNGDGQLSWPEIQKHKKKK